MLFGVEGCVDLDGLESFFGDEQLAGRTIKATFGHWVGKPLEALPKHKCHGWDRKQHGGQYVDCWVFKAQDVRLYGFLFNPFERDRRFQAFVPVCFALKHEWDTETRLLDRVCRILDMSRAFPWKGDR